MGILWWRRSVRERLQRKHDDALAELKESRRLRERDQRTIVTPLKEADNRNHFSDLLRAALVAGYGTHGKAGRGT